MDATEREIDLQGSDRKRSHSIDGSHSKYFADHVFSFGDWNASSMGVNRNGTLTVLAARRGFLVVDFDHPTKARKIICNNKWEPGALEWNPHSAVEDLFASVMNQKIEIWNVKELSSGTPRLTLSGHTRAISDINWNYFDPYILLTCSMDTYINLWDTRQSRKPSSTFTTVAGSSQVKWNRKNKNLFASAHDGDVRIWDIRKGNIPYVYIAGHLSKIHGLDWSPQKESDFVTASNDSTVKFWNMTSPKQPRASINNGAPVWKARYTPFGNGLVTVLVPQLRRNENSLFLWNTAEFKNPVHKFDGHTDVILEFQWRSQRLGDHEEYQLISWSKDQSLRLWTAEKKTLQAITGEYDKSYSRVMNVASPTPSLTDSIISKTKSNRTPLLDTSLLASPPVLSSTLQEGHTFIRRKTSEERPSSLVLVNKDLTTDSFKESNPFSSSNSTAPLSPSRSLSPLSGNRTAFHKHGIHSPPSVSRISPDGELTQLQTLQQEFALINLNNPVYKIDSMEPTQRVCIISTKTGQYLIKLHISFPLSYPDKVTPNFQFSRDSNIDIEKKKKITKALIEVSQQHVKINRPCLEPCLRQLVFQLEELNTQDTLSNDDSLTPMTPPSNHMQSFTYHNVESGIDASYKDLTVPFPRTCGARFCGVGDRLVIFARPEKFSNIVNMERTLRSLSALTSHMQNLSNESTFDENEGPYKKLKSVGLVYVTDTSCILPVSRFLAHNYILNGDDPSELCLKNADLARSVHRKDLVQTWSLLAKVMSKKLTPNPKLDKATVPPWTCHPFGKKLVNSLFNYYEGEKDIQMLALMSCMLAKQYLPDELKNALKPTEEESKVVKKPKFSNPDGFQVSPEFPYDVYNKLSSGDESWSPPTFVEERTIDPEEELRKQHHLNCRLLDPNETFRYDQFKRFYAEILYRWNCTSQRTEVMKYITEQPEQIRGLDLCLECSSCKKPQREPYCASCKSIIVKCSVCRVGVRGLLSFCMVCGHGGHMFHLVDWFGQNDWCATGCGCYCLRIGKFASE